MNDFYCQEVLSGKTKVEVLEESENVLAFYHTKPSWSFHTVVIPKKHIITLFEANNTLMFEIFATIKKIIQTRELDKTNYKIITNGGSFQDSKHLHFHLVSGEKNSILI